MDPTETKRTKVTLVVGEPGTHGSRLGKEIRTLAEAGYEVHVLCWDRGARYPKRERCEGYTVRRCHLRAPYGSRWLFLFTPLWYVFEFFYLLFHRCEVVHAMDFDTLPPAVAIKLLKRTKLVYDVLDFYSVKSETIPKFLKIFFRVAEQSFARRADGVIIADEARRYLLGKRPPKRVVVINNCAYDQTDLAWRKREDGAFIIFYGGLIDRHRGIEKLVRATAGLDGVKVITAGWITYPPYQQLLHDAPHVEHLGTIEYAEALRRTYEADAVYAFYDPALEINRTANSSKMFDAFMCGTAVLANSEPPAARLINEFECGAAIPYDDEESLRETIVRWRDDRSLARRLGQNGRRAFEEQFNWPRMAERILALYREIGL